MCWNKTGYGGQESQRPRRVPWKLHSSRQIASKANQQHRLPEHASFSGRATLVVMRLELVLLYLNAEGMSKPRSKLSRIWRRRTWQPSSYYKIWSTVAGYALQLKESYYCPICCEVYPDNENVFNSGTEGCEGIRYKGPRSSQM